MREAETPKSQLIELLADMYDPWQLTSLLEARTVSAPLVPDLPATEVGRTRYAAAVVRALLGAGLVDATFWEWLHEDRPRRSKDIERVAQAFVTAPAPALTMRGPSPFTVGPPIDQDEGFFGRHRARRDLMDFIGGKQSVEILGERRVGKTSLLRYLQRHAPSELSVVSIDAQSLAGRSPGALVEEVARQRRRLDLLQRDMSAPGAAEQVLEALCPVLLLLDEAEVLAVPGHGFSSDFFAFCRSLCQAHRLVWVSTSTRPLGLRFKGLGLSSPFLNDSRPVWMGALEPDAVAELLRPVGASVDWAMGLTGGWAWGVQWVGDALWRGEAVERVPVRFAVEAAQHFARWWEGCSERERGLLKGAVDGYSGGGLGLGPRLEALAQRGLLRQGESAWYPAGEAWTEWVRDAG